MFENELDLSDVVCWNCEEHISENSVALMVFKHEKNDCKITADDIKYFICSDCETFKNEHQKFYLEFADD